MNKSLAKILFTLFICIALTLMSEQVFKQYKLLKRSTQMQEHIAQLESRLQDFLDNLVQENRTLAKRMQQQPNSTEFVDESGLLEGVMSTPPVMSIAISKDLKVVFVHPLAGNESVTGIDYQLRPEFIRSVRRAKESSGLFVKFFYLYFRPVV